MASFEPSPDLDPTVAQAIQEAMDSLRAELLGHLRPAAAASAATATAKATATHGDEVDRLSLLEEAVGVLDGAPGQAKLLGSLLEQAGRFADRTLFVVRDQEVFRGWAAFGFAEAEARVTDLALGSGGWSGILGDRTATDLDAQARGEVASELGAASASEAIAIPFWLRGRAAGALIADGESGSLDRPALRLLTYIASQALETLPLRQTASPVPAAATTAAPSAVEVTPPAAVEPAPRSEVATSTADADLQEVTERIREIEADTATPEETQDIVEIRHDVTAEPFETPPDISSADTSELDDFDTETSIDPVPESGFATQEISALDMAPQLDVPAPASRAVDESEVAPPSDLEGPGWAFGGADVISDDSRHEEARRLARLLVTEIKLYNEEKVREGRENNSLYRSLREDIDRSKRIYEERIDAEINEESDYFQDELVRILAGGDSTALGT